jgi:hypothetical protein
MDARSLEVRLREAGAEEGRWQAQRRLAHLVERGTVAKELVRDLGDEGMVRRVRGVAAVKEEEDSLLVLDRAVCCCTYSHQHALNQSHYVGDLTSGVPVNAGCLAWVRSRRCSSAAHSPQATWRVLLLQLEQAELAPRINAVVIYLRRYKHLWLQVHGWHVEKRHQEG